MKIFDEISKLSNVRRWSRMHCIKDENVLEHTAFVALYSIHICTKHNIAPEYAVLKAVVHDIEESVTGDICTTTKYYNEEITKSVKAMESEVAMEICERSFDHPTYLTWLESKNLHTTGGSIVAISDLAAVVFKIRQEVDMGNKTFLKICPGITKALNGLKGIMRGLFDEDITQLIDEVKAIENS